MERGPLWEHQVFCAVAERQSFVLAARALGASPSAVTRAVRAGAPAGRATADAQQDQRDADAAGRALCRVGARHAAPGGNAREALRSAAPRAGCAFPRPTCWAWHCCRPCCGAMPRTTRRAHRHQLYRQMGGSDRRRTGLRRARGFPPPASCWARACGPMSDCYAPARTTWRAWDCPEPEDLVRHRLIMHTGPRVLKDWHLRGEGRIQRLRGAGPARQHRQQPDGAGAGRHGRGAAGGLGRAAGNRARHAGARVSGLYRDLGPGRVAPGPRRVRIALLAGPRPRHAGRLAPGRRRPHGRSSPPATPPARHAS